MKKSYLTNLGLFLFAILFGTQAMAQTVVNMPHNANAGTFTIPGNGVCSYTFNDEGGAAGAYSAGNNNTTIVTFAPSNPANKIRCSFITPTQWVPAGTGTQNNSFAETTFDAMFVYDGNTVGATVISGGATATSSGGLGATGWNNSTGYPTNYAVPVVAGLPTFDRSVRATAANATGALTFRFTSDASVQFAGWSAMVWEENAANGPNVTTPYVVPVAGVCTMTAPANITASVAAGTCAANVTTAAPSFAPAGCNSTANLFYSVDGGTPILVGNVVPATITILNLAKGVHTITWSLVNLCGGNSAAPVTQTITINDNIAPTITCPGNVTINLPPGDCRAAYSYTIGFTDNCPLVVAATVTQNPVSANSCTYSTTAAMSAALSLNCGGAQTKFARVFGGPTQQATTITGIELGQRVANGGGYTVNIYNLTAPATTPVAANMVLLGGQAYTLGTTAGAYPKYVPLTFTTPIPIAAGSRYVVEIISATGNFTMGNLPYGDCAATPSYIAAAACGLPNYGTFASVGFATLSLAFNVNTLVAAPPPTQTSGLPSGAEFPIGVTTNCFTGADIAGNTASCCFTVTVKEYPNAITSLICNDHVEFSLDVDCVDVIGADDILEGGPYGCYDNYIVELDKVANSNPNTYCNGPWVPAVLGPGDVNKTYCVRVTDPKTGNSCWGEVKVEDKLKPTITCYSLAVPCNGTAPVDPAPAGPQTYSNIMKGLADGLDKPLGQNTVRTYTFNVPMPSAAVVTDVDVVGAILNHTWLMDVKIELVSPSGLTKSCFEVGGCAGAFPIDVQFDDSGQGGITSCLLFNLNGGHMQCFNLPGVQNPTLLAGFNGLSAGGNWKVVWTDKFPGADGGDISKVGLVLTANVPPAPAADNCDANLTLTYTDKVVDNGCAGVVLTRTWTATDDSGNTASCSQNITYQTTTLAAIKLPPSYDNITAPAFDCAGAPSGDYDGGTPHHALLTPDWIEAKGLQGRPLLNGLAGQGYCDINWEYEDVIINICQGSYKIRRKWIILDWCTGQSLEYNQVIKVLDSTGPSITADADVNTPGAQPHPVINNIPTAFLGTDFYQCCSKEDAPALIVSDNCSDVVSAIVTTPVGNLTGVVTDLGTWPKTWQVTFPNGSFAKCFPVGTHTFTYTVYDQCGNSSTSTQRVIVRDLTPPVALCQTFTTVAVGINDTWDCYPANGQPTLGDVVNGFQTVADYGGVVWVPATAFNDGSYDNCSNMAFTVRRMAPYTDCINNLNPQDSDPLCNPNDQIFDFVSEYQIAIQENDSIKFYCCEVGTQQTVIFRAYELDENGNLVLGTDNQPIYNECMVQIEVQDKIKPFCQAPQNLTVNCEQFDPLVWYGALTYGDNCCVSNVDTAFTYIPNQIQFEQCNYGQVRRRFTVFDCHNNSSQCTQTVTVNYREQYRVYFPDDQNITQCNGANMNVQPIIYGENCELIGISSTDQVFNVVPDACYKILRTWKVINWCTYNPNQGEVNIPNSTATTQGSRIWIGGNGTAPNGVNTPSLPAWANYNSLTPDIPTVGPLVINYPAPLTGGTVAGQYQGTPAYIYTQIIKVQDQTPPTQAAIDPILSSPNYDFCDYSTNDPLQWNQNASYNPYGINNTWSPACESHDLCEGLVDLSVTGTDACTGNNVNFSYQLFLDLDGNGTMETILNSEFIAGQTAIVNGFTMRAAVDYGFGIQESEINGNLRIGRVTRDFETDDLAPTFDHTKYPNFELPYGNHKIKWTLEDRCGNNVTKEYPIYVHDCKNPTIVCSPHSVNGMNAAAGTTPAGVVIWASDFLNYVTDNCSDLAHIKIAIRDQEINPGSGFPVDGNGNPQDNLTWDCSQLGTNNVELWAVDKAGNADFCATYLILTDNTGACGPVPGAKSIAGAVKTKQQIDAASTQGVSSVQVSANGQNNGGIPDPAVFPTSDNGTFNFAGLPVSSNWNITPAKDNNPLNGVSTLDLVRMSKHILGVQPFTTGYQYLAADVNNNKQVTTFDIVELRKLILGIYPSFPSNTSWRFVEKSFNFDLTQPSVLTQPFKEFVQVGNIQNNVSTADFVGVKIGDLTGDAIANNLVGTEDRSPVATQLFDVKDRNVTAGEEVSVEFNAADLAKAGGFQFTMNFTGLDFVELVPGANVATENFAVFAQDKAITASWNGDASAASFTVKFRATQDGKLSQLLGVSSRITPAEAYTKDAKQMDVAFRFNGEHGSTIAGVGFEVYQNTPNPFVEKTFIGFNLPTATNATLTVYDNAGKALYTTTGNFAKGYNSIPVDRASLKGAGLVYYTIETATDSATKKMIMMD